MANKKKRNTKSNKSAGHRAATKKKAAPKKAAPKKKTLKKEKVRGKSQSVETVAVEPNELVARSGRQSGDLQGLSNIEGANSESLGELLEEGNAFEADVVKGVQDAGEADGGQARTHEVPQDDVPKEYLDKDE